MMKRIFVIASAVLVIALLAGWGVGCKASPAATEQGPIKIGFIGPLTGFASADGLLMQANFDMAVKLINEKGGIIGGRKIETSYYDDQASSAEAVKVTTKAIVNDKVKAIVGYWEATCGIAGKDVCKKYLLPLDVAISGPIQIVTEGYHGCIQTGAAPYALFALPDIYWMEKNNIKTVSILGEDVEFAHEVVNSLHKRWDVSGSPVKILEEVWHPAGKSDLTGEVTKLISHNPEAIVVESYTAPSTMAASKALHDLGYSGLRYQEQIARLPMLAALGDNAEGSVTGVFFTEDPTIPANEEYCRLFRQNAPASLVGDVCQVGSLTYDGTMILLLSMDKAGTDSDNEKIWAAEQNLDYTTCSGDKAKFSPEGRLLEPRGFMVQIKGGKVVVIDQYPIQPADFYK